MDHVGERSSFVPSETAHSSTCGEVPVANGRTCGVPVVLRNEHHGRLKFTSIRGELVWLFIPVMP